MAKRPLDQVDAAAEASASLLPSSKYAQLETDPPPAAVIQCSLAPHLHPVDFPSYQAFDLHYAQQHVNRCVECTRNFPTGHFLELHIAENHDPLNQVRRARAEKIYACFVEGCDRVCSAPAKRRRHLIDKHMYPKDYDFDIVDDGIDQRNSMLRYRRPEAGGSRRGGHQRRRNSAAVDAPRTPRKTFVRGRRGPARGARQSTSNADGDAATAADDEGDGGGEGGEEGEDDEDGGGEEGDDDNEDAAEEAEKESNGSDSLPADREEEQVHRLTASLAALKFVPASVQRRRDDGSIGSRRP